MSSGVWVAGFDDLQDFVDAEEAAGGCSGKHQQHGREEYYDGREHQNFRSQVDRGSAVRVARRVVVWQLR